ncbi:gamma-glutamylcyclotransferase family protein [Flammeovirgaceae bacterium SG7u.111]|nr:gamma-glutamylcyclotransferase family protein [Flammeovirgaceae bacterium SG7u.132]WPO33486.1 gamma-glutamylcyclotransferase family protein [Flammeovirgaceae bacterium SG7u.111]
MIIFSYGSNMNLNRITQRVPSAKKITNAYLDGYLLKCIKKNRDGSGKATIIKTGNIEHRVWGILYNLDEAEKHLLDKAEGLHFGYNETHIEVTAAEGEVYTTQVYIAAPEAIDENLIPYHWYKAFIVSGAKENNLPASYMNALEKIPSEQDPNEERQLMNRSILKGE